MELKGKLTPGEMQAKQQEIVNLTSRLSSTQSDIGDWKITKTYEARLKGEEDPYDTNALMDARQEVRDRINELQQEINAAEQEV